MDFDKERKYYLYQIRRAHNINVVFFLQKIIKITNY